MHAPIHAEPIGLPALQLALELARRQHFALTESDRTLLRLRALPYALADRLAIMQDPAEIAALLLGEINATVGASASDFATL